MAWCLVKHRDNFTLPYLTLPYLTILILYSHLHFGFPYGLLLSGFPTKILRAFLISPMRATGSAHLILLDLVTLIIFGHFHDSADTYGPKSLNKQLDCDSVPIANWLFDWLTDWLIPWNRDILEKLIVAQLVKFTAFYGTQKFITVFIRARQFRGPVTMFF
jgi:hypothetical protein